MATVHRVRALAALALAVLAGTIVTPRTVRAADTVAAVDSYPAVTDDRLVNAQQDDGWLMFRRSYDSRGYAPFEQITKQNVAQLKPVFTYASGLKQGHEAAPVVNGRYLFVTTPMDHLIALDATTGTVRWTYVAKVPPTALKTVCCDVVNRGVALYGNAVYMATLDNHVVALDAPTGKVLWNRTVAPPGVGYAMTGAPLIVGGQVVTGIAGGEFGARCFVLALDAKTGAEKWRTYTVPAPNEPGGDTWPKGMYKTGGGGTWLTGSYDPDTKTLLWGVGNPGPWFSDLRPGKNLYTDSVMALDPADGHRKWSYQFTPHDAWDYDGVNESVLADISFRGQPYKALLHADRNGNLYAIDRTNGKFIYAKPFVPVTGVTGFAADGTPVENPAARPHLGKTIHVCPSWLGGKNWWSTAYDPDAHLLFIPTSFTCMTMKGLPGTSYKAGLPYMGESFDVEPQPGTKGYGELQAVDANTGTQSWAYTSKAPWNGPVLATKGGLVFTGTPKRGFMAFDAASGKPLWTYATSSGIIGVPTSYQVDGKQYVAVWAGWGGVVSIFGDKALKAIGKVPTGGRLYVFALP